MAELRPAGVPRFVVMATESVTGGVMLAGWDAIVTCAVGGTSVICGGVGGFVSAGGSAIGGGLSPWSSSFLSSNLCMRPLTTAMVWTTSALFEMRSL